MYQIWKDVFNRWPSKITKYFSFCSKSTYSFINISKLNLQSSKFTISSPFTIDESINQVKRHRMNIGMNGSSAWWKGGWPGPRGPAADPRCTRNRRPPRPLVWKYNSIDAYSVFKSVYFQRMRAIENNVDNSSKDSYISDGAIDAFFIQNE